MRRSRSLALPPLVALVAAAAVAGALPAAADTTTARATGPTQSVTLELTPRDAAAIAALAKAPKGLSRSERIARVDAALPGTARAADVARRARALGLTVTHADQFSVGVQAPASTVRALFGSARAVAPRLRTAQALPTLPSSFGGLVAVALGGDDDRPALLPRVAATSTGVRPAVEKPSTAVAPTDGSLSIAQMRGTYRVPGTTTAQPGTSKTTPTVATLQFPASVVQSSAGRSRTVGDVSQFAVTNKVYGGSGLAAGAITGIAVTPSNSTCSDPTQGDPSNTADEVALDQETLLSVAPQLAQRVYYAPNGSGQASDGTTINCAAAQDDALQAVYTDIKAGYDIVALSTSWGSCEANSTGQVATDQTLVNSIVATGVSVFAASGDTGSFDCVDDDGNTVKADAVDDPGSLANVVAVGGVAGKTLTTLTTWNSDGFSSGGGFSCSTQDGGAAQPSYQAGVSRLPTYRNNGFGCSTSTARRQVPDIATDGADGIDVYVSEYASNNAVSGVYQGDVYGTSFSAPLAAGGFAQTLTDAGKDASDLVSNLPTALYGLSTGLTDVLTGTNGDYAAGPGWDPTTGLGTPHWPNVVAAVTGGSQPSNGPSVIAPNTHLVAGTRYTAPGGNAYLQMQSDGNLVVYDSYSGGAVPTWQSRTGGNPGATAVLQYDSNIVIYSSAGKAIFDARTSNLGITSLAMLDDGTLTGLSAGGLPIWSTPNGRTLYGLDHVPAGGKLDPGDYLTSPKAAYRATMTTAGNLVITQVSNGAVVKSFGSGVAGSTTYVGADGNVSVQKNATSSFATGTSGNPHGALVLDDSGVLSYVASDGIVTWTSTRGLTGSNGFTLVPGQYLLPGVRMWSGDGSHDLVFQGDGNLVVYDSAGHALWSSRTSGKPLRMVLQGDGNLVVYNAAGVALFNTRTQNKGVNRAILQGDGNFVLYAPSGAKWSWKTGLIG